ncbi:MAG: hypothetical protein IJU36_04235 [Paludibacteraceae bacterium]|nr:hypothetical protein [Paludibacteraceae bacterium]
MRVFIAPLNWGLGHATRCVPLIERYRQEGHEVILGGDGESLIWLKRRFPTLRIEELAQLSVRYSATQSQVGAMLSMLPDFIRFIREDHRRLQALQARYHFDLIVSDNRFGLYLPRTENREPRTVYLTHQLRIRLPHGWRWAEPLAERMHAYFYRQYDEVWVPDYEDYAGSLAGWLSHPKQLPENVKYIGPLSRFSAIANSDDSSSPCGEVRRGSTIVALLSGPEPQRSLLEESLIRRYEKQTERVLIVRGLMQGPLTRTTHGNITLLPRMDDDKLIAALLNCRTIIARSGYTTIMDLHALRLLHKAELIPTPGQSEQEYLKKWLTERKKQK